MCFETTCKPSAAAASILSARPSARSSTSIDQRISKLDTRLSRSWRHFLASFLLGVKCRVPWILYRSLDPFFHCLKTLLWRIKFSSPSLLLCARSQAVFDGMHPVKHRYIRWYVSAKTGEPFVVFPCVLYVHVEGS